MCVIDKNTTLLYSRYNTEGKFIKAWDFPAEKMTDIIKFHIASEQ